MQKEGLKICYISGKFALDFSSPLKNTNKQKKSRCIYRGKVIFRYVDKVNIFMSEYGHGCMDLSNVTFFSNIIHVHIDSTIPSLTQTTNNISSTKKKGIK